MHPAIITCPATCELCGNWLPQHQTSCPRNGVHPSQWQLSSESTAISLLTLPPLSPSLSTSSLTLPSSFVPVNYHPQEEHDYDQGLFPSC